MAIMHGGLFGKSTKKLGNIVMRKWKTKNTASAYQPNVKNPKTPAQLLQRNKFASLNQALKGVKDTVLQVGFINPNKHIGLWAEVVKINGQAQTENEVLMYADILLSKGNLKLPIVAKAFYNNFLDQFSGQFIVENLPSRLSLPFKTNTNQLLKAGAELANKVKRLVDLPVSSENGYSSQNTSQVQNYQDVKELIEKAFAFLSGAYLDTDGTIKPLPTLSKMPVDNEFSSFVNFSDDAYFTNSNHWVGAYLIAVITDAYVADKVHNQNLEQANNFDFKDFSAYVSKQVNFEVASFLADNARNRIYDAANSVFFKTEMMVPELVYGGTFEGLNKHDIVQSVIHDPVGFSFEMKWNKKNCPHGTLTSDFVNVFLWIPEIQNEYLKSIEKARFSDGRLHIKLPATYTNQPIFIVWQLEHDPSLIDASARLNSADFVSAIRKSTINIADINQWPEYLWDVCKLQPASLKFKNNLGGFAIALENRPEMPILNPTEVTISLRSEKLSKEFSKLLDAKGKAVLINIPPSNDYALSVITPDATYIIEKTYTVSANHIHQAENILEEKFHVDAIEQFTFRLQKTIGGIVANYPDAKVTMQNNSGTWQKIQNSDDKGAAIFENIPVPNTYAIKIEKTGAAVNHPDGVEVKKDQEGKTVELLIEVDADDKPVRIVLS